MVENVRLNDMIVDYQNNMPMKEMVVKYGVAEQTIRNRMAKDHIHRGRTGRVSRQPDSEIIDEETRDHRTLIIDSTKIRTVEEALAYAEVDTNIWEVEKQRIRAGHWDTTVKNRFKDIEQRRNYKYHIEITLRRKAPQQIVDAVDAIINRMKDHEPVHYEPVDAMPTDYLMEISLFDVHFGMLAWGGDAIQDQDIHVAERFYLKAVRYLLDMCAGVSQILIPFGNDFFHTNNPFAMTPKKGNMLDTDGRLTKIFEVAQMAVIKAIEMCRQVAPVDILWVPGNHDPETSFYLAKVLDAWFRDDTNVYVNCDAHYRKCYQWGNSFIGFTHGDEEPIKELPRIFMDEFTNEWADTNRREIHIGHTHKQKETSYVTADSYGSTIVRTLPSLSATDAWHYQKGYVGKLRAAQGFLWHKEDGLAAIFPTYAKEE